MAFQENNSSMNVNENLRPVIVWTNININFSHVQSGIDQRLGYDTKCIQKKLQKFTVSYLEMPSLYLVLKALKKISLPPLTFM